MEVSLLQVPDAGARVVMLIVIARRKYQDTRRHDLNLTVHILIVSIVQFLEAGLSIGFIEVKARAIVQF
jgi:hypothetical protein